MFHFTTPVPPSLSIEVPSGEVIVDTAGRDDTTIELVPLDDHTVTREAITAALVEQRGDVVAVRIPERLGRSPRVGVRVAAPDASGLVVRTGSARIAASGRFGTTRIDTGSGHVQVGVVDDSARVQSGSGDVRIEHVEHDTTVRTGSGDVRIGVVRGEASFTSGSGDLELVTAGRAVVAKTGSGDVTIGTAPADLRVTTASGNIRIDAIDAGEVRARAASGDITAGIRRGTAAWLDVSTVTGRLTSTLESTGEPAEGQARVRLLLSTASGDIDLGRV